MKKTVSLVLLAVVLFGLLTGCGKNKMYDTNIQVAQDVIEAVDRYLDGKASAGDAREEIDEKMYDVDSEDSYSTVLDLLITSLGIELALVDLGEDTDSRDTIIEYRDEIAGYAGLAKYKG